MKSVPSLEEMISVLQTNFEYSFNEYKTRKKIIRSNTDWSDTQVSDELGWQKRRYENELRENLRETSLNIIEEIENLVKSLNQTISEWKIKNL